MTDKNLKLNQTLNTCSLNKNFDVPEYFIKNTNQTFDVITISESRIKSNMNITTNINLLNYSIEETPRNLIYIGNTIAYKPRKDLNIYISHELESTFVEITDTKQIKYNSWCSIKTSNNESSRI